MIIQMIIQIQLIKWLAFKNERLFKIVFNPLQNEFYTKKRKHFQR